eukprot:Skav216632  [mRNA]  locus=scaffold1255:56234:66455:+ [translate_table: standard]
MGHFPRGKTPITRVTQEEPPLPAPLQRPDQAKKKKKAGAAWMLSWLCMPVAEHTRSDANAAGSAALLLRNACCAALALPRFLGHRRGGGSAIDLAAHLRGHRCGRLPQGRQRNGAETLGAGEPGAQRPAMARPEISTKYMDSLGMMQAVRNESATGRIAESEGLAHPHELQVFLPMAFTADGGSSRTVGGERGTAKVGSVRPQMDELAVEGLTSPRTAGYD